MDEVITRNNILKYKDKAFSEEEYVVYYQPKYNQYTGMLVGAEALARWQSPEMGFGWIYYRCIRLGRHL